jgi:Ser/Thr protein kinase RdoA (MazF antagonist)
MSRDRPYVDERVTAVDAAGRVAAAGALRWHLPAPELMRVGMNAIYACGDVVLRVGRATAPAIESHALAGVLLDRGIPVVAPIDGFALDISGFAVTAWQRVRGSAAPIEWSAVGAAVARIHALERAAMPDGYPIPSPAVFPWWDFDALLGVVADHIDPPALVGLRRAIDSGRGWARAVEADAVICHGDVHPGNVMMTESGPLLIDFDLLCRAAPAWDHAMLTTYAERWGGDPGAYEAFASGYGCSLADDDTTRLIAMLRNVAATLMRVRAGITDPAAAEEAGRRLRYWRGESDAPAWRAQ